MKNLGDNLLNRLGTLHPNQTLVQSPMEKSKVIGIKSELVQNSRMKAAYVKTVGHGLTTQFIGFSHADSTLDATSRHPHGVDVGIVIAAQNAGLEACSEIFGTMGTRSVNKKYPHDMFWRNCRTISLHDPIDYKCIELGKNLLHGEHPEPGVYQ